MHKELGLSSAARELQTCLYPVVFSEVYNLEEGVSTDRERLRASPSWKHILH